MPAPDRLELLANQTALTGLDFVSVAENQTELDLHFLVDPDDMAPAFAGTVPREAVVIHPVGREEDRLPVLAVGWPTVGGRRVLRITLPFPGGFERYRLRLESGRIDDWYSQLDFSFKVHCDSGLDCRPRPRCCPEDDPVLAEIDTTARDFWALRGALMDFAAERWPDWQDRLAPDLGVTLAELAAALGDEFAYVQDQVAHETRFDSARERRSLRHHARLVDYEPDDGAAAAGWLSVMANAVGDIPAGTPVAAPSDRGEPVVFEIGNGLADVEAGRVFAVDPAVNSLPAYVFEEDPPETPPGEVGPLWPPGREVPPSCLPRGATELWLDGHHAAGLTLTDIPADPSAPLGRWVLLRTDPADPSMPARRHVVRLIAVADETDELNGNAPITHVVWEDAQALPADFDLASLTLEGNLVPVTAGLTHSVLFAAGEQAAGEPVLPRTVEREGPSLTTRHLFTLPESAETPLTRHGPETAEAPDMVLHEMEWDPLTETWQRVRPWDYRQSLLGTNASLPDSRHFTLDDGVWAPVVRYWRDPALYAGRDDPGGPPRFEDGRLTHYDLQIGTAATIRFGTNDFGLSPAEGTVFECRYRLGGGRAGNLARETISDWVEAPLAFVDSFTNPLPMSGGRDPETAARIRRLAPALFKALTFRAVTEPDYIEVGERLDWVEKAGARFRHTGSWLSLFSTADPRDRNSLPPEDARALYTHLDLFRQTGRQIHVVPPRYADIDLDITICVAPGYVRGDVKGRVLEVLFGRCEVPGFFGPENFTFGAPLYRSRLEAVIQGVEGVRAVEEILIRRRGVFDWQPLVAPHAPARADEIIRVADDPAHPEWGFVILTMEGGS